MVRRLGVVPVAVLVAVVEFTATIPVLFANKVEVTPLKSMTQLLMVLLSASLKKCTPQPKSGSSDLITKSFMVKCLAPLNLIMCLSLVLGENFNVSPPPLRVTVLVALIPDME